jgi:DNA polymerase-3 subunit epsilon
LSHFNDDLRSSKEMQLSTQVRRIETILTAGELGALIKESALVKELMPLYNRQLRRSQ